MMDRRQFLRMAGVVGIGATAGLRLSHTETRHWFSQGYIVHESETLADGTIVVKVAELTQVGYHPIPQPHRTDIDDGVVKDWLATAEVRRVPICRDHDPNAVIGYVESDTGVVYQTTWLKGWACEHLDDLRAVLGCDVRKGWPAVGDPRIRHV